MVSTVEFTGAWRQTPLTMIQLIFRTTLSGRGEVRISQEQEVAPRYLNKNARRFLTSNHDVSAALLINLPVTALQDKFTNKNVKMFRDNSVSSSSHLVEQVKPLRSVTKLKGKFLVWWRTKFHRNTVRDSILDQTKESDWLVCLILLQ